MAKTFLETSIQIHAPASKIWGMFTDPAFTNQMGGQYVSDWEVGSLLQWRGLSGQILTSGTILEIEPEKVLQHNLFITPESSSVMAVLTYNLVEAGDKTTVHIHENFTSPISDQEYTDALEGWNGALTAAKEIAEKLD